MGSKGSYPNAVTVAGWMRQVRMELPGEVIDLLHVLGNLLFQRVHVDATILQMVSGPPGQPTLHPTVAPTTG